MAQACSLVEVGVADDLTQVSAGGDREGIGKDVNLYDVAVQGFDNAI